MTYPTILIPFQQHNSIHIPDPEKIKYTFTELKSIDHNTPFPFWAKIWPSAFALTAFLKDNLNLIQSKTVLEIGAGIGLPSFSIADVAKEVIITDHSVDALNLIQKNIDQLKFKNVRVSYLDWNNFSNHIKADTILLSDINYDPTQIKNLVRLINHFLAENSTIIISTPERITATPFGNAIRSYIKESFLQEVEESGKRIQIRIMII